MSSNNLVTFELEPWQVEALKRIKPPKPPGSPGWPRGRKHTKAHNRKISAALVGHEVSEETRAKLREAWVRRKAQEHAAVQA